MKFIVILVDNDLIALAQSVHSVLSITIDGNLRFGLTTIWIHNLLNSVIHLVGADATTELLRKYNLNLRTIIPYLII